jgi:type IX secretion system PorP/SprF family membrane protein
MKWRITIALVLSLLLIISRAIAQSPTFSQYYASALYLSPALTGLEKDVYMGMNYRSQWSGAGIPFSTFQFSFISPILKPGTRTKHLGGLGATFYNDVAGPGKEFKNNALMVSAAYNFHLTRYGNNIVSVGLQAGAMQQRVNIDNMQWASQYSPDIGYDGTRPGENGTINGQVINPLVNTGVMWSYTTRGRLSTRSVSVFNGIVVANLLPQRSYTGEREPNTMLFKLHGGVSSLWKRKLEISPNYLIQYQNHAYEVNVGAYFSYYLQPPYLQNSQRTKIMVGAWYRLQDAVILSAGISTRSWNFGFSYDNNVSSLTRAFGYASAYEVSLAYKIIVSKGFKRFSSPLI